MHITKSNQHKADVIDLNSTISINKKIPMHIVQK